MGLDCLVDAQLRRSRAELNGVGLCELETAISTGVIKLTYIGKSPAVARYLGLWTLQMAVISVLALRVKWKVGCFWHVIAVTRATDTVDHCHVAARWHRVRGHGAEIGSLP